MLDRIKELFGDRASDDALRRFVYGHDMGALPDTIGRFIDNVPSLVVQPVTEDEVIALVNMAREAGMPIVPRGGASAGFGGAVPAKGGIVVDFVRMSSILTIDAAQGSVTVEPGVIYAQLEKQLGAEGLRLPLYPTSALSATVAGWVAQGGAGIGSRHAGDLLDNLVSVRAVLGDGTVREFAGDDLELVYAMEGITGIITRVKLRVLPAAEMTPRLVAFATATAAQTFVDSTDSLGLWHVNVQPPHFVALKNRATGESLPEEWLVLAVYTSSDATDAALELLARNAGGRILSAHDGEHEWGERFYPLRGKKFGPSIVATDVVIPLDKLPLFASRISAKFGDELVYEATAIGRDEYAIIGFMLADERKLSFTMLFSNSLAVNEVAKKAGGRAFAAGMYLTPEADAIFGRPLLERVAAYKRSIDPKGILNPGKVLPLRLDPDSPVKLIARAVGSARGVSGIGGALGKVMAGSGKVAKKISDLPNHMEDGAFACASCGFCRSVCTVFAPDPWEDNSPRGKWYMLKEYAKGNLEFDQAMATKINLCTTCKRCDTVCEVSLHMAHEFMGVKPYLLDAKDFENTGLAGIRNNVLTTGNFWGAPGEGTEWRTEDMRFSEDSGIGYWPGCWSSVVTKNSPQNAVHLMNAAGIEPVYLGDEQVCCGLYHVLGGYADDFSKRVASNLELMNRRGIKTIVTSCPGCFATFTENYAGVAAELGIPCDVEFKHIVVYLSELIEQGALKFEEGQPMAVTYHDSCHLGRWFGRYDEPRRVLNAIPGLELREMEHSREEAQCCGLVGAFYHLPTVQHSAVTRVNEAESTGAEYIITNCAGCASQFNAATNAMGTKIKQRDLTDLAAEVLGYEVYDPTEAIAGAMQGAVEMLSSSVTAPRACDMCGACK
ncbi:MAG: FAD-binding and (Fe-S)-binding domain-containing protein [Coriobacteriia bacterium]